MAEYQQMKLAGHSAAGHVSGLNLKSATEHGSSPARPADTGVQDRKEWRNTNR